MTGPFSRFADTPTRPEGALPLTPRVSLLSAESDLHPRLIRIALDYAAEHSAEVRERIERNQAVAERAATENVADFASERDIVLAFVLKNNLPAGCGQAAALAKILDRRAQDHPEPYLGHHWPAT